MSTLLDLMNQFGEANTDVVEPGTEELDAENNFAADDDGQSEAAT